MKTSHVLVSVVVVFAAGGASGQGVGMSYTDVAPYTDTAAPVRASSDAPRYWKGQLTRAEVQAALQQARAEGTVASGEAIGYPYSVNAAYGGEAASASAPAAATLMGAPDDGLTIDGYRFVGGEAGYVYVGRARPAR